MKKKLILMICIQLFAAPHVCAQQNNSTLQRLQYECDSIDYKLYPEYYKEFRTAPIENLFVVPFTAQSVAGVWYNVKTCNTNYFGIRRSIVDPKMDEFYEFITSNTGEDLQLIIKNRWASNIREELTIGSDYDWSTYDISGPFYVDTKKYEDSISLDFKDAPQDEKPSAIRCFLTKDEKYLQCVDLETGIGSINVYERVDKL